MKLRAAAPGKVNLALSLGAIRPDGRHRLVTLFESVSLADTLVMEALPEGAGSDQVRCPSVPGPNLVGEALAALRRRGWDGPPVHVEIDKRIPVAAGMGGGSADAAAMLRLASEIVPGRPEEVAAIAAALGADVPSQLAPGLVLGTGAGEDVESFPPLGAHALVIVPLAHQLSTPEVYREADRLGLPRGEAELEDAVQRLQEALHPDARLPAELLRNDLEPAAVSLCPSISRALEAVREAGAEPALVCGSGPTVAGLFWGPDGAGRARSAARRLSSAYPGAVAAEPVGAEFGAPTPC